MPIKVYPAPPVHNRHDVWQACDPGAGGIMNARSCARFFAMLANGGQFNGVRLLSEERVRSFTQPRDDSYTPDAVLTRVAWVGVSGYWLGGPSPPAHPVVGTNPNVLCHASIGGSIGWADLDARLSVAICHNWMHRSGATYRSRNPFIPIVAAVRAVANEINAPGRRNHLV